MYILKEKKLIINDSIKIIEAINRINSSKIKILFVVNKKNRLVGSISSGDIRRSIRKKIDPNNKVDKIMCRKPKFVYPNQNIRFSKDYLILIPVVNKKKEILRFHYSKNEKKEKKNTIFLMAGGKGRRMLPLTKKTPKPLLKIKGTPIIEKIIKDFRSQGFRKFIISINYLGEKIINYLGDGKKLKVDIAYIKEKKFLGTAGSLSLLNLEKTTFPILVANSDLISEIDYNNLINYHIKRKAHLTICAKNKIFEMPYGEIILNNIRVKKIVEKPLSNHLVNAGIYVINKSLISKLTKNKKMMMNDFVSNMIKKNKNILSYPIYEKWLDIGNKADFLKIKD